MKSDYIRKEDLVPALYVERLLYDPSIAASKDRIVSKGRSRRGRVGLDRSGSAISVSVPEFAFGEKEESLIMFPSLSRCSKLRIDWMVVSSSAFRAAG